jgi:hypothetical protein
MPQYQGVWTLQQQMQALTSGQWVTDPNFKNTTLLLQGDSGANGAQNNLFLDTSPNQFAITRNGNTTQGSFTPFSQAPGYWSNYLTSSNYLSVTSSASLASGTSSFTLEFWYNSGATGNGRPMGNGAGAAYGANNWVFGSNNTSGKLELFVYNYNTSTAMLSSTSSSVASDNQWHHIAIVRSTNTWAMFIDGVRQGSTVTSAVSFNGTSSGITIGFSGVSGETATAFVGYLSNVRFVNGSAIYDPTQTVISVPSSTLTPVTNTVLLTCQSNAFVDTNTQVAAKTISVTGTPSVQPFSPFAPQYQWTSDVIGGSAYMDGSGDYLTISNPGSGLTFGTNPFTVEAWVYPATAGSGNQYVCWIYGNTVDIITIYYDASTKTVTFTLRGTNLSQTTISHTTGGFNPYQWNHLAIVRNGTTFAGFVNGVISSTTIAANAAFNETQSGFFTQPQIGAASNPVGSYINGYVSGWRALKGTAQYTASFTPPTAPPTAITNTAALLNFTNAGIYDGTMKNNLETVGNAQISTSVVKYGSGSIYLDGTGDYLFLNSPTTNLFSFGTGDFTIEFWVNTLDLGASADKAIIDFRPTGTNGAYPYLYIYQSQIVYWFNAAGAITQSGTLSTNVWYHVALCRSGSSTRLFINGVQSGSTFTNSDSCSVGANRPVIGVNSGLGANFNGYLDDIRITKGLARYIANFTPPLVALPRQ